MGVVNRGQRDVSSKTSVAAALQREQDFFKGHAAYRSMMARCSTPTLSRMLNQILMHHIRDCLPDIKNRITGMMVYGAARHADGLVGRGHAHAVNPHSFLYPD